MRKTIEERWREAEEKAKKMQEEAKRLKKKYAEEERKKRTRLLIQLGGHLHKEGITTVEQVEQLLTNYHPSKMETATTDLFKEIIERYDSEKGYLKYDIDFNKRLYEFAKKNKLRE